VFAWSRSARTTGDDLRVRQLAISEHFVDRLGARMMTLFGCLTMRSSWRSRRQSNECGQWRQRRKIVMGNWDDPGNQRECSQLSCQEYDGKAGCDQPDSSSRDSYSPRCSLNSIEERPPTVTSLASSFWQVEHGAFGELADITLLWASLHLALGEVLGLRKVGKMWNRPI
jgi:hypothetical protein